MQEQENKNVSIRTYSVDDNVAGALMAMEPNDVSVFPLRRTSTVRVACSTLGLMHDRVYRTNTFRSDRTIRVTRIS